MWGLLAVCITGAAATLKWQLIGLVSILGWVFVTSFITWYLITRVVHRTRFLEFLPEKERLGGPSPPFFGRPLAAPGRRPRPLAQGAPARENTPVSL